MKRSRFTERQIAFALQQAVAAALYPCAEPSAQAGRLQRMPSAPHVYHRPRFENDCPFSLRGLLSLGVDFKWSRV